MVTDDVPATVRGAGANNTRSRRSRLMDGVQNNIGLASLYTKPRSENTSERTLCCRVAGVVFDHYPWVCLGDPRKQTFFQDLLKILIPGLFHGHGTSGLGPARPIDWRSANSASTCSEYLAVLANSHVKYQATSTVMVFLVLIRQDQLSTVS